MLHACPETITAGSYVLGVLTDREHVDFHRHAEACSPCYREILELAPVADFLAPLKAPSQASVPTPRQPS